MTELQVEQGLNATRRQRERQKAIGLKSVMHVLQHTFSYFSLPSLPDNDLQLSNFSFYREREQTTAK